MSTPQEVEMARNIAKDFWIMALPEDIYGLCPCGCDKKMKFLTKDPQTLQEHENRFVEKWLVDQGVVQ